MLTLLTVNMQMFYEHNNDSYSTGGYY